MFGYIIILPVLIMVGTSNRRLPFDVDTPAPLPSKHAYAGPYE